MESNQEKKATHAEDSPASEPPQKVTHDSANKHPRRKKSFIIVIALVVVALIGWLIYRHHVKAVAAAAAAHAQPPAVPVVTGRVRQKDVPIYLDGLGTVQAFNTVTVHTRVDGQLVKVAFTEGEDVKTGDLLAQIDPAPYQAALDQTVAKTAQDAAQLANARVDLQRYDDLLKTDAITQQTFDTQKALTNQLQATVQGDEAATDSAKVNLDYTTIRSPIDGRTGIRQVDQGNIVHASDTGGLAVLTQLKPISVIFTLPEAVLTKLQDNQGGTNFTVLAMARNNTNVLATGQLSVIDNQIDSTTGTLKLKATFANENLRLWPGQFVNVRLLLQTRKDSMVVPASVVQRGPEGAFAFVVGTNQTVKMSPLKVAQIDSGEALIDEGLQPGDIVVVDGQYKLQDGSHIKAAGSTNAPSGSPQKKSQHKSQDAPQ